MLDARLAIASMFILSYSAIHGCIVQECGMFLSIDYRFLATSPDSIILLDNEKFGIVEVKCPYKDRDNSIETTCQDQAFCLCIVR